MTAPTDVPFAPADGGEVMSPEAVTQMERRLLDAFSQHHHQAGRFRRHAVRWIGVAAALSILTGAAATWRSLRVDHARPELVTRRAAHGAASGRERRPGFRHTGSGWRDRRATRFRRQRRDTAGGCSTRCSFAPARTGGEAGGVHRTTGSREPSDLREWRDRPYGSRTLGACRIRTRHLGRGRKKSRPGGRPRRPGRRTSRYPGRHQFLEFVDHLHGADNEKSRDRVPAAGWVFVARRGPDL